MRLNDDFIETEAGSIIGPKILLRTRELMEKEGIPFRLAFLKAKTEFKNG